MKKLSELFNITYGNRMDLNKLTPLSTQKGGVNFVGRSSKNLGVSATVASVKGARLYDAGLITVALGGSKLLTSFVQESPFYTAQNVAVLEPNENMLFEQKLYVCLLIQHNRFRYSAFGREENRTIKDLLIPDLSKMPKWIYQSDRSSYNKISMPALNKNTEKLKVREWKTFSYSELFLIEKGTGPQKKDLNGCGSTPFITSTKINNGLSGLTIMPPTHPGNTITVNQNGNVGEAFYQSIAFCSTQDVHIFKPKFNLTPAIAIFLIVLIRKEKFRFGYGRKWGFKRMNSSIIRLPVTSRGKPDWNYMSDYINSLPYSSQL